MLVQSIHVSVSDGTHCMQRHGPGFPDKTEGRHQARLPHAGQAAVGAFSTAAPAERIANTQAVQGDRLDATYLKQREGGRIVSVAAIIAVAVNTDGKREIVGLHIGPSEAETFWSGFLKSLARCGLRGVKLVISDAHEGLKAAIRRVFGRGADPYLLMGVLVEGAVLTLAQHVPPERQEDTAKALVALLVDRLRTHRAI
jgi:hypothetical protein